uniref:28S ribosomal protein S14, mitochondrial n=1 Tax=Cacopsylla melanoneura TaxID=428564 RepID=A0A8D8VYX9_9HEMI
MNNIIRTSLSIYSQAFKQPTVFSQQVRNKWVDFRQKKDARKRKTVEDYGAIRMRLNVLRKNRIIPMELQEAAHEDVLKQPRDSNFTRCQARCVLTSRPRGVLFRWRLSRIVFRHLADYNKMSGVQRAMW